jgi:hypothetical protein
LISNNLKNQGYLVMLDLISFVSQFSNPSNPEILIEDLNNSIFAVGISNELMVKIKKDILLAGQSNDFYWTELWTSHIQFPKDTATKNMLEQRLRALVLYLMSLPEYQLM